MTSRPPGQTKCEKWFKDKGLVPPGSQLSAEAMATIQGFPPHWLAPLSPPIPLVESEAATSPGGLLPHDRKRSRSVESSTSIKSPTNFRRRNTPISEPSKSPTKRRGKNKIPASGHISPTIQRKNGKDYPVVVGERVPRDLAWDYPEQFVWLYNWSVQDEDGCWKNRSKRVPMGKVYSVRAAIVANKPVEEVLKLINS